MVKVLYIIRHGEAQGQAPEAPLTPRGLAQATALADFLAGRGVRRIVSSPFVRACQSIAPLAERLGLPVETDARLVERVLGSGDFPDWHDRLARTFSDLDLAFPGGESSRQAMRRAVAAVQDILAGEEPVAVVVSHGNLIALLLKWFDDGFGFTDWQRLSNPDVFRLDTTADGVQIQRVWPG